VLPAGAAASIERSLDALDAAVPKAVIGLHVTGSLALGDYHPERSDIDVVFVTDGVLDAAQRGLVAEVHRVVATRIDGPYVPLALLGVRPEAIDAVPFHVDGRFEVGECHEVSPITWAILAEHAITVRGDRPCDLGVRADHEAVRTFSRANLGGYWARWARTIGALLDGALADDFMESRMLEWGVLGVARVHCAAYTGDVVSKRAGGEYALRVVDPEWHDLVQLALASRAGGVDEVRVNDLRRACAFVAELAE
jgi:nucleotidyltransferase-like protein/aminoglycoside adenylyltransferase-like protein